MVNRRHPRLSSGDRVILCFADQDDRPIGLLAARAADPGDPVRPAGGAVNFIRSGGAHRGRKPIRFGRILRSAAILRRILLRPFGPFH